MPHPIRAVEFDTVSGRRSWTVVGADGLPIEPLEDYLQSLRALAHSANTVKSYARHLSLYWRWLDARQLPWDGLTFSEVTEFIAAYRVGVWPLESRTGGVRARSSVRAVGAAVKEFYEHHRLEGRVGDLSLTRRDRASGRTPHNFLAHVERKHAVSRNRLTAGMGSGLERPPVIRFEEDFERLLEAAESWRDKLLLSALYDGGLRISQALGLWHEDLGIAEKTVTVIRRTDNPNDALSKSKHTYTVHMPKRFFDLYSQYLLKELVPARIEDDMLFVNLRGHWAGRPMSYSNAYQQIVAVADRAGVEAVHPHVLRHTHATHLARKGWTTAEIAARIGQGHASSADRYVHLASDDLGAKAREFQAELEQERNLDAP